MYRTVLLVFSLAVLSLHAQGAHSEAPDDLGRKLLTHGSAYLAKGKAAASASFTSEADLVLRGLYNRYPTAASYFTSLNYPNAFHYTRAIDISWNHKASHLEWIQARRAAIWEKRMAIMQAHYAKHYAKSMMLAKSKGVVGMGLGAASVSPLAALLPPNMLGLSQLGREAIPFLLNGVNRRTESPNILSLISLLNPEAVGDLEGLISGLFLGREGNPMTEDMLVRIVSGLLGSMPRDMENLNIPEAVEGLLRLALNAFSMLTGGSAEPGFAGLPSPTPEHLLPNLARIIPDFLNLLN